MAEREIKATVLAERLGVNWSTVYKWLRGKDIARDNLIKLADFFRCTLDYLTGRSDDAREFIGKPCPPFSSRLKIALRECRRTQYQLMKENKISGALFFAWYHGAEPSASSLVSLANALDCTLDFLVGRE